jgi:mono/diheme cytochrome c family protein
MIRKPLKWVGIGLGGLIGLLAVAFVALLVIGGAQANKTYDIPVETISIPTDEAAIQRGEHLATIFICTDCHTQNLSGELSFEIPGMLTIPTPNLTSGAGGVGRFFTDEDWVRAIRHGVGHDGRALFVMPSNTFNYIGNEDLGALIAYLKSLPPVDNEMSERRIDSIGRVMMAAGMMPPLAVDRIDHSKPLPDAPEPGVTVEYGKYLSYTCTECHGANLNGAPFGPPGQEVPSPNLTPGGELASWSEEAFINTLRTGVTPGSYSLNEEMPWMSYGQMTDDELKALWLHLQSLPALEQG